MSGCDPERMEKVDMMKYFVCFGKHILRFIVGKKTWEYIFNKEESVSDSPNKQ